MFTTLISSLTDAEIASDISTCVVRSYRGNPRLRYALAS